MRSTELSPDDFLRVGRALSAIGALLAGLLLELGMTGTSCFDWRRTSCSILAFAALAASCSCAAVACACIDPLKVRGRPGKELASVASMDKEPRFCLTQQPLHPALGGRNLLPKFR